MDTWNESENTQPEPEPYLTLAEVKQYLRVDFPDDDNFILSLLAGAEKTCVDILRWDNPEELKKEPNAKIAMLYYISYLYENRESANHLDLMITLRALLSASRKEVF